MDAILMNLFVNCQLNHRRGIVQSMTDSVSVRRGRPKLFDDTAILDAALEMFARDGYEGASLRSLNRDFGLSHGAIHGRFGTKDDLYLAVVDYAFQTLQEELLAILADSPLPGEPLHELQARFRAFILATHSMPYLNHLMNMEGLEPSWHLDHIYDQFIEPMMRPTRRIMDRLVRQKVLEPVPQRTVFFLLAHGAATVFGLRALAEKFDPIDGPIDSINHADLVARLIVEGMRRR